MKSTEPERGAKAAETQQGRPHGTGQQADPMGPSMHPLLKRHAVQVLLAGGKHTQAEIAAQTGTSVRTVRTISGEPAVTVLDDADDRQRRRIGRPSKAEPYREAVEALIADDPTLPSVEILRRCRERGFDGGKSALYELIAQIRPSPERLHMRFEGLPGEFSQHDFGQVDVRFLDGHRERVVFFASRLKWSRFAAVSIVADQTTETLVRALLDHFVAFGGVPLAAVFDRPRTVALKWSSNGAITDWNPTFALAAVEIGFVPEVCWPYSPEQKGAVENLVKWVKGSFFKVRRFHDRADLEEQLAAWLREVNHERPSRATAIVPAVRLAEERPRLRAPRVLPDQLALRVPAHVGPTGYVVFESNRYALPPRAAGLPATIYVHRDRIRIQAGPHQAEHPRLRGRREASTGPEHRAQQLAAVSGDRGRRYLRRQHLLDTGEAAERFLTELVHHRPRGWFGDVDRLHDLLQRHGPDVLNRALRAAVDIGRFDVPYVEASLGALQPRLFPEATA